MCICLYVLLTVALAIQLAEFIFPTALVLMSPTHRHIHTPTQWARISSLPVQDLSNTFESKHPPLSYTFNLSE